MTGGEAQSRRELKREYKESRRPMGVFQVRNTATGRILVDASVNLPAIFNRLRAQLGLGAYLKNRALQADWDELGADAFAFEVLEELEPPDAPGYDPTGDLQAMRELWIEQLQPFGERGYNRSPE
jgi:hypothetical protein